MDLGPRRKRLGVDQRRRLAEIHSVYFSWLEGGARAGASQDGTVHGDPVHD